MRPALAILLAASLCASPALAQGKTKAPPVPQAVQVVEMCEKFARGDVLAVDDAIAKGWDAYEQDSESPYVRSFAGSKDLPGIGAAEMFALVETYPGTTFGYCRVDVIDPPREGNAPQQAMQDIQNLPRYEGTSQMVSDGSFASLTGAGGDTNTLLLAHWSDESFVVQLSVITPGTEGND